VGFTSTRRRAAKVDRLFDLVTQAVERRMIIDVHSHVWEYPRHFGDGFRARRSAPARGSRSI